MKRMQHLFTKADYDRLPEGFPAQLIGGLLVDPRAETIERLTHDGIASASGAQVLSSEAVPGFALCPDTLFA